MHQEREQVQADDAIATGLTREQQWTICEAWKPAIDWHDVLMAIFEAEAEGESSPKTRSADACVGRALRRQLQEHIRRMVHA